MFLSVAPVIFRVQDMPPAPLLRIVDPIPQAPEILIVKRDLPNVFIEFDGFLEPAPCLRFYKTVPKRAGFVHYIY
jgi:hypothetical protein